MGDGSHGPPVHENRERPFGSIAPPSGVPASGVHGALSVVRPIVARRAPAFIDDEPRRMPSISSATAGDAGRCASSTPRTPPASLDLALLRGALEESPLGVATTRSGEIVYANGNLERLFGAPPNGLEHKHVAVLFDPETFLEMSNQLEEKRVFDGRVKSQSFDGRAIDAEVHVEWYSSEELGIGGFLVFRDVGLELGALGRLLDLLGGALFRIRIEDGVLEYVSPAIGQLTGLDPSTCIQHPVLLTNLVSLEERERLAFLYKRVVEGELATATTQVNLRRPDGRTRCLHVRATGRRDATGVVRRIEGVVNDVAREQQEAAYAAQLEAPPPTSARPAPRRRVPSSAIAPAVIEIAQDLLREVSQHLHTLGRAIGLAQLEIGTPGDAAIEVASTEIAERLDRMARSFSAASALNRRVRLALAGATSSAPMSDLLEQVRVTLGPVITDPVISVNVTDAGTVLVEQRVDEMILVFTYLALRAFRAAGSGSVQLEARRVALEPSDPRMRSRLIPNAGELLDTLLVISGGAHPESSLPGTDISCDLLHTPRRAETDQAFNAAKSILAACNASIELDEVMLDEACTAIRLRG